MRIKEICKTTGLTDKAVRFYINNQLISPNFTENYAGRKNYDFSEEDINILNKIAILRKYNFSISDIKDVFENEENISFVLENHLMNTQQDLAEFSIVIANLDNALNSSVGSVDELCTILNERLEPESYDLKKELNSFWKKLKKKLPKILLLGISVVLVAIILFVVITLLLSNFFMMLD